MEFDEPEEQEEEIGMHQMPAGNYQTLGNSSAGRGGGGEGVVSVSATTTAGKGDGGGGGGGSGGATTSYRYRECLKNHAVGIGGHAVDGCGEFMAAGEEGTLESLKCAACSCHRNFHRKESQGGGGEGGFHHHPHPSHHQFSSPYSSFRSPHPSGYLHITPPSGPHHQRPLALPSTSREDEDVSNPSSSGGGGGGGGAGGSSKKRFRTKFTAEQKEKMLGFAERLGWRIQKQDEALVQQFCTETNVKRHVLKVWMHNNKHTIGKKP
ncbi:hypothetical protein ACH5RR_034682 [Cinchona calisaya]|uniref:ZF-HD dimerization-type domain-containing protein n=1 Tax=Cinchona calisaya TaxID=153742 RepID=A0ABD2YCY6_9GENT